MTVILSNSNLRHVSATHVTIFRVVRTRIQLQLMCRDSCIVVVITQKMAAWVAQTCRWLLCNKITWIVSSSFFVISLKKICIWLKHGTWKIKKLGAQKFTTVLLRVINATHEKYFNASIGSKIKFPSLFFPFIFAHIVWIPHLLCPTLSLHSDGQTRVNRDVAAS